ncbi:MAG: SIS domain-containing protein [Methanobrevibacter sp.]|nr:SIS domain-containing protein [Methanobrevibacter sp.]
MFYERTFNEIISHSQSVFNDLDNKRYEEFINIIAGSDNIFVLGGGRSGLVAKAFAMRLKHLGLNANVIGENTAIERKSEKSVLIAISGSGKTPSVVEIASKYKKYGVKKILSICSNKESRLAKLSDLSITIKSYDNKKNEKENYVPMPLGTSFELSTLLTLESTIPDFMKLLNVTEEDMADRHANYDFIDLFL